MSYFFPNTRKPNFRGISALDYDAYWRIRGFHLNTRLKEREEIILHRVLAGASVFDIGCGNSLLPVMLQEKGCSVTVGDVSTVVLDGYAAHDIRAFKINLEEVCKQPIKEVYDYIILSEVLEHTKNPEEIVQELKKYTNFFIFTIPNSAFYRYRFHILFRGRFFTQWVSHPSEHLRFWSHVDFIDWVRDMGLIMEESYASNGFSFFGLLPHIKNLWKNLFGHQMVYIVRCPARK
ncbi:MAG: methionine biosynthesis protein MetW [Minisyncoccota bacterium]